MINWGPFLHYFTSFFTITAAACGVGIGQGLIGKTSLRALLLQPSALGPLRRTYLISLALTETSAILAGLMSLFILRTPALSLGSAIGQLGICLALGLPAAVVGIFCALPIKAALLATARQPLFSQQLSYVLFLIASMAQTPVIFGFVISWIMLNQSSQATTVTEGLRICAGGLALGLGSLGPIIGNARFGAQTCTSLGVNRTIYKNILSFTFFSQAIVETPVLLCLSISLFLLSLTLSPFLSYAGLTCMVAALTVSLPSFGVGLASGYTAEKACRAITLNPENYSFISRTCMLAQTLIDTNAVYGLLISIYLVTILMG